MCVVLHRQSVFRTIMKRFCKIGLFKKCSFLSSETFELLSSNNWVHGERYIGGVRELLIFESFALYYIVHCTLFEHDTTRWFIGIANDFPFDLPKPNKKKFRNHNFVIMHRHGNDDALFYFQIQNWYLWWW